jgi:pimeloyl-ACP methyl ester carboxylesterase
VDRTDARGPNASIAPGHDDRSGQIVRFRSQDDLSLAARLFSAGPANRLPLLCLAGLSRNSRDFLALGRYFSTHPAEPRRVIALDYRGRGLSESDRNWRKYTPMVEAQDVLTATTVFGIERAILVGTSRGGIIAMLLGALRPALIAGVVLNDIGPVVEGTGLARIKTYLSATRTAASWEEAVAMVRNMGGGQFPGISDEDVHAAAEAYFAPTDNGLAPQFDAKLLRAIGDMDLTQKLPELWPQFASLGRVPVLAIRGELSDILSPRTLTQMAERHPRFEQLTVRGQGHAPLLRDSAALDRIRAFAPRCDTPER